MRGKKARRNQAIRTPFQITKLGPKLPIVLASELVDNPSPCHGGTVAPSEACNSTRRGILALGQFRAVEIQVSALVSGLLCPSVIRYSKCGSAIRVRAKRRYRATNNLRLA